MRSNKNKGFEFGYAAGVYFHCLRVLSPGIEFYAASASSTTANSVQQPQHLHFPVAPGRAAYNKAIAYNIGPGFGLTRESHCVMKSNIELKRFVVAIWSP